MGILKREAMGLIKNSTENKIVEEKADTKNIQVEFKDFPRTPIVK